jgi:hypothetical protein
MEQTAEEIEIAPGLFFKKEQGHFRVCIQEQGSELIVWDYEEICESPEAWFASLKAASLATQHGPSVARAWVEKKREEKYAPSGSLYCNMCNKHFVVELNHPFAFIAHLNGIRYQDYQCSEECNKKRYQQVYNKEMGSDFMKLWAHLKVKPIDDFSE